MDTVTIPKTLCLLANCWNVAEKNLREFIQENGVSKGEEFITGKVKGNFYLSISFSGALLVLS